MEIRTETGADLAAVGEVNRLAFGREAEARLVDDLRDGGYARLSLVAEEEGRIVGRPWPGFSGWTLTSLVMASSPSEAGITSRTERFGSGSAKRGGAWTVSERRASATPRMASASAA